MSGLVPRLNYHFSLREALVAFQGLWRLPSGEQALCSMFGCKDIFYFNHGRTGLRIALSALDLPLGSGVAVLGYNCLTVLHAVKKAGLTPVFIDITDDFQTDLKALSEKRTVIKAVIINHLFGIPNRSVLTLKTHFPDLPVIEDCAHAFLTRIDGRLAGTIGDISVFSYGMSKFPSARAGGFLLVNNSVYLGKVIDETNKLEAPSFGSELKNIFSGLMIAALGQPVIYKYITIPFFKKVDDKKDLSGKYKQHESLAYRTNRYLFFYKLKNSGDELEKQKKNGKVFLQALPPMSVSYPAGYNYFMLPVLTDRREDWIRYAQTCGIELGRHFSKIIKWAAEFGYAKGSCPNAESIAERILTIPTHACLKEKTVRRLSNLIKDYCLVLEKI